MPSTPATLFVCTTCRTLVKAGENGTDEDSYIEPGHALVTRLERLTTHDEQIAIEPVECLAVCTRPCTVALAAPGKWTYIVGDVDTDKHAEDIAQTARAYAATENGIVAWKERPPIFKKGVVARVPPRPGLAAAPGNNDKAEQESKSP